MLNLIRYLFPSVGFASINSLYEITLAKEAIMVPSPPILTPNNNGLQSVVKLASKIEAGTLLINWLRTIELKNTEIESFKLLLKIEFTALVLEIFPTKIKKLINVKSN